MKVTTTTMKFEANKELATTERLNYYLILGEGDTKYVMNIGKKSYECINEILKKEKGGK